MKLIIVRHGEPDYEKDDLTDRGMKEAELLSRKLCTMDIDYLYCSPLGRAKRTASFTEEKIGRMAEILPWMCEFRGKCLKPGGDGSLEYCWDWRPEDFTKQPLFFDKDRWLDAPEIQDTNIGKEWTDVCNGLDALLEKHGYKRNGMTYKAVNPNEDTLILFCHLALEALIVSHLTGLSPFVMLHSFAPAPTAVTTIATEERTDGVASFRVLSYGDVGHLYKFGMEPSFAGRFCECFKNKDQRH